MELTAEQMGRLIGLAGAAGLFRGRGGRPPTAATLREWARAGYRPLGWAGSPVVLRTVVVGRDYLLLPEWASEFEAARLRLGDEIRRSRQEAVPTTCRKAQTINRAAAKSLDKAGVK